jgi:hypothetical protein
LPSTYRFETQGNWDTTFFTRDGQDLPASRLYLLIRLKPGDKYGNIGQGDLVCAYVPMDGPSDAIGLFPGTFEISVPGHEIVVRNESPSAQFEATRIEYQGLEMTSSVAEVYLEVDSNQDLVAGRISLYQGGKESNVETFSLF